MEKIACEFGSPGPGGRDPDGAVARGPRRAAPPREGAGPGERRSARSPRGAGTRGPAHRARSDRSGRTFRGRIDRGGAADGMEGRCRPRRPGWAFGPDAGRGRMADVDAVRGLPRRGGRGLVRGGVAIRAAAARRRRSGRRVDVDEVERARRGERPERRGPGVRRRDMAAAAGAGRTGARRGGEEDQEWEEGPDSPIATPGRRGIHPASRLDYHRPGRRDVPDGGPPGIANRWRCTQSTRSRPIGTSLDSRGRGPGAVRRGP
ncbi:hypothetical protein OJF2_41910 [Aquisphaera giovannonii]|uniref:Uncharacterized protein n=1 Tax=Aquisphaera giovannonii TaxID=406548 RepID=A0A5B9W511_9BACT|nr:hypothetical protein OJF2_41910 [Aquisphaera giovannonii]